MEMTEEQENLILDTQCDGTVRRLTREEESILVNFKFAKEYNQILIMADAGVYVIDRGNLGNDENAVLQKSSLQKMKIVEKITHNGEEFYLMK